MAVRAGSPGRASKRWEPTSEQAAYLLRFRQNNKYYIEHMEQLKEEHGGKFIAVLDGDVVLDDTDAGKLLESLRENYTEAQLAQVYITYVPLEQEVRIA